MEEYQQQQHRGRIWRSIAIVVVVALLFVIILINLSAKPNHQDQVWNPAATIGKTDAANYYIMYTDLMCPYCDVFSREAQWHWDEFRQYLDDNDILFEVRLTDYLYEGHGESMIASRYAAEAGYCAMRENKFWEYYHGAIQALWDDYHSKGIGVSKTATPITNLPDDYWRQIGHAAGLGTAFDECLDKHDTVAELEKNTARALQTAQGMPYFKFNRFATSGFDNNWNWDYVLRYLDAGLSRN